VKEKEKKKENIKYKWMGEWTDGFILILLHACSNQK
jgi:hypothetical protein